MAPAVKKTARSKSEVGPVASARMNGGQTISAIAENSFWSCSGWTLQSRYTASATAMPSTKLSDITMMKRSSRLRYWACNVFQGLLCEFTRRREFAHSGRGADVLCCRRNRKEKCYEHPDGND